MNDVLADPVWVAQDLVGSNALFGLLSASGRRVNSGAAVLDLTLEPLPALATAGYPVEKVKLVIHPDQSVRAFCRSGPSRPFKHRNALPVRNLCLQYNADDAALRWLPEDGIEELITRVHRHLMAEEAWRRTGSWPFEDAPHGQLPSGSHAVRWRRTRQESERWAR